MPFYIDFSETCVGPTLFDFIKHEVALWDWNLAARPAGRRPARWPTPCPDAGVDGS